MISLVVALSHSPLTLNRSPQVVRGKRTEFFGKKYILEKPKIKEVIGKI
jgi:hypothetical protein